MSKRIKKSLLILTMLFIFMLGVNVVFATKALPNPLGTVTDPREIIGNLIRAGLGIVGSIALLVFIWGGFTWVIAGGNEEKIKKGKDLIIWASFGLVVIFFSYAIVMFVITAVSGAGGDGEPTRVSGGDPTQTGGGDPIDD